MRVCLWIRVQVDVDIFTQACYALVQQLEEEARGQRVMCAGAHEVWSAWCVCWGPVRVIGHVQP